MPRLHNMFGLHWTLFTKLDLHFISFFVSFYFCLYGTRVLGNSLCCWLLIISSLCYVHVSIVFLLFCWLSAIVLWVYYVWRSWCPSGYILFMNCTFALFSECCSIHEKLHDMGWKLSWAMLGCWCELKCCSWGEKNLFFLICMQFHSLLQYTF